jgi:hypothetical protein
MHEMFRWAVVLTRFYKPDLNFDGGLYAVFLDHEVHVLCLDYQLLDFGEVGVLWPVHLLLAIE